MKFVTDAGITYDLGVTETTPTVGITDFSRRVTDDFGVTTVVRRGFARRMSVRFAVPYDTVDAVQARMAALRATPALYVADDRYRALSVRGIYKDFDIDLAVPPTSYCTLSVDGLSETDTLPDPGGDAAPEGSASTLRLVQPVDVTDAVLTASSVAENDAPAWSADVTYADAARVIVGHRVYESLVDANRGADPVTSGKWVDIGPTGRWAMFDDALGSVTSAAGPIVVSLAPEAVDSVVLLDVTGATVRVQAAGYDRMLPVVAGAMLFDGLPGGALTVTVAGASGAAVGTLLVGRMVTLGITEASPTAGISDFSRKEVDDFGEVTIVQRAWSKRMAAKALIASAMVDAVFDRIAAVRARPCLWIGDAGTEALTIFGFFKDFSIEVGENVSKLSLSIEGLSAGAPQTPRLTVPWANVTDPKGTKPVDNATNSADPASPLGPVGTVGDALKRIGDLAGAMEILADRPDSEGLLDGAKALVERMRLQQVSALAGQLLAEARKDRFEALAHLDGVPMGTQVKRVERQAVEGDRLLAETIQTVSAATGEVSRQLAAEVTRIDRAIIDGDTAQAEALLHVGAQLGDDLAAAVTRLDQAIVDGDSAQARALASVRAALQEAVAAEVLRLDRAIVDGDHAQAEALAQVSADFGRDLAAAVTRLDQAIASGDSASAQALASVKAALEGAATAESARLDRAIVDGDHAQAEALAQVSADFGSDLAAAVTRLDQAIATGDSASAQALASVKAALEGAATAESARLDRAIVDGDHAQADAIQKVSAKVGTVEASVTQHAAAIVDLEGKVMAYLDIEVEAGTNRAIVRLAADGRDGSTIDFAANALRFANPVDGKNITAMRVAGGNVEVVNDLLMGAGGHIIGRSGGYMTVTGAPFGSQSQFIEWYGPVKSSLAECTAADAISYKTVAGDAYFGGSLTAGVLRNAVRTSALIGTANVTTGVFGSNGGARVVVVSLDFAADASIDGACPIAEQPRAKVQLWRGVDAETGTLLVEQTFVGTHECLPGHGPTEPGGVYDQLSGSFTFTDTSGGATAAYFARIVERSAFAAPHRQQLSLVSTEE